MTHDEGKHKNDKKQKLGGASSLREDEEDELTKTHHELERRAEDCWSNSNLRAKTEETLMQTQTAVIEEALLKKDDEGASDRARWTRERGRVELGILRHLISRGGDE